MEVVVAAYLVTVYWSYPLLFEFPGRPRPMTWFFGLLIIVGVFWEWISNRKPRAGLEQQMPLLVLLLCWLCYTVLNGITVNYDYYDLRTMSFAFILSAVLPCIGIYSTSREVKKLRLMCYAYVGFTVLIAIYTYIKFPRVTHVELNASQFFAAEQGLFTVNYLKYGRTGCFTALISVMLILDLIYSKRKYWVKWTGLGTLACCFFLLVAFTFWTGSRQAMLGVAFGLILLFILIGIRRVAFLVPGLISLSVLVGIGYWLSQEKASLVRWDQAGSAANTRMEIWREMFNIFLDSPFFGNGLRYGVDPHNIFLDLLAGQGLIGFFLFTAWMLCVFRLACRPSPFALRSEVDLFRACMLITLLTAFLVLQFSGGYAQGGPVYWFAVIVVSLNLQVPHRRVTRHF